MGGRGASGGLRGGGGAGPSLSALTSAVNRSPFANTNNQNIPTTKGDYTANGNPNLTKYQGQEDDKTARYLAKVWNDTDYSQYNDPYGFYNNSYQKLVLSMGLNEKPTVLKDADFDKLAQQTNAQVVYRGWSSERSANRFMDADYTHVGNGFYGDGIYFTPDLGTAALYGVGTGKNAITKMMLSPTARVVDIKKVRSAISSASPNLQVGLAAAGSKGSQSYGRNGGEAQMALKMGYNVIKVNNNKLVALTRDAFIVSDTKL